jgi:NitT/TauT family transport system substrate-binding protein
MQPSFLRKAIALGTLSSLLVISGCAGKPVATPSTTPVTTPAPPKEKAKVRIIVGGMEKIIYLPAKLTEALGFYAEENLDVTLANEAAGQDAEVAMLAGEVEGVVGFYDHTIDMQSKGKKMENVIVFDGSPGEALMVSKTVADKVKTIKDLKGSIIGVTGLGSSTNFLANFLVVRGGNKSSDYTPIAVGAGQTLIAAMKTGKITAAVTTEPTISLLLKSGDASVLVDMRDAKNTKDALGGTYPAAGLYMVTEYVDKNPETVQHLVNAFAKTLHWIHTHTVEEIAAKLPTDYYGGDKDMYLAALKASITMFTEDGKMPAGGPETVLNVLSSFNTKIEPSKIDLAATYTTKFVEKVPK